MVPQAHRLKHRNDFARLRQHGRKKAHPLGVLIYCPNEGELSRFGFSASRRVGNAVQRNRGKRLLREAIRLHIKLITPGWDCLFIVRDKTPTAAFADVQAAVLQLLGRANLLIVAEKDEYSV